MCVCRLPQLVFAYLLKFTMNQLKSEETGPMQERISQLNSEICSILVQFLDVCYILFQYLMLPIVYK